MRPISLFYICLLTLLPFWSLANENQPGYADKKPLVLGIFPRRDPVVTNRIFTPLKQHLQQVLQRPVILETSSSFSEFSKKLHQRRYDLVHFNQYHYVTAHRQLAYDVLVQNEEFGEKTISGTIYVRQDSGINNVADLKGKTVLFGGGKRAMMSYIIPKFLLMQNGLNDGDYLEMFANSPPNAVLATYLKQADACGAGEIVWRLPIVNKKIKVDELKLIAKSKPLPHLPWAVKRELPEKLTRQLKSILLGLISTASGKEILQSARLTAFNPVSDNDYDAHRQIIRSMQQTLNLDN